MTGREAPGTAAAGSKKTGNVFKHCLENYKHQGSKEPSRLFPAAEGQEATQTTHQAQGQRRRFRDGSKRECRAVRDGTARLALGEGSGKGGWCADNRPAIKRATVINPKSFVSNLAAAGIKLLNGGRNKIPKIISTE